MILEFQKVSILKILDRAKNSIPSKALVYIYIPSQTYIDYLLSKHLEHSHIRQWSPIFLAPGPISWKTVFPQTLVGVGCFQDDSSAVHLLHTLFLLLLHYKKHFTLSLDCMPWWLINPNSWISISSAISSFLQVMVLAERGTHLLNCSLS